MFYWLNYRAMEGPWEQAGYCPPVLVVCNRRCLLSQAISARLALHHPAKMAGCSAGSWQSFDGCSFRLVASSSPKGCTCSSDSISPQAGSRLGTLTSATVIFHSILGTLGAIVLFFSVGPYRWTLATVGRPDSAVEEVEMVGELHSRPHPITVAYCWLSHCCSFDNLLTWQWVVCGSHFAVLK